MECLEEGEGSGKLHIRQTVLHEVVLESHPTEQVGSTEGEYQRHKDACHDVEKDGKGCDLFHLLAVACSEILRAEHGRSDIDNLEYEECEGDELVGYAHAGNCLVSVLREHKRVGCSHERDKEHLDEDREGECMNLFA